MESDVLAQHCAEIKLLKVELKTKDDKIAEMEEHVLSLETEQPLQSKKRRLDSAGHMEMNEELVKATYNKDIEIQRLTKEIECLKARIESQDEKQYPEQQHSDQQNKEAHPQQDTSTSSADTDRLMKMIEEKLSSGLCTIQTNVIKLIDNKFNNIPRHNSESVPEPNENSTPNHIRSYAATVGNEANDASVTVKNFRTIMMATKNEELAEEADRKRRGKNLIMHGKEEMASNEDSEFVNNMIKDLQIGSVSTKQVERIGQHTNERKRPIKLVFNSEEDQQKVLTNLRNLKDKSSYKGISITDDYTLNERLLIKEFTEQAKIKNTQEETNKSNIIWRVRGSPKNGLIIKKFTKANSDVPPQQA